MPRRKLDGAYAPFGICQRCALDPARPGPGPARTSRRYAPAPTSTPAARPSHSRRSARRAVDTRPRARVQGRGDLLPYLHRTVER